MRSQAAGGVSQLRHVTRQAADSAAYALIPVMKGHEDDGMFFGMREALPGQDPALSNKSLERR